MRNVLIYVVALILTGCGFAGPCGNGDPFALFQYCEKTIPYAYGAHWIKDGMTKEGRRADFVRCGGGNDLREGYEIQPNQSNQEFFDGFKTHTYQILNCMKSNGYAYLSQCDARCLYP